MSSVRCFIFDLDGTLVFNEHENFLAYQAAFKVLGIELEKEEYTSYFGLGVEELIAAHANIRGFSYDAQFVEQLVDLKWKTYEQLIPKMKPNRPLITLLQTLAPHFSTALTTTARRRNAEAVLCAFDLTDLFDTAVFGEDVSKRKPDPECYRIAAERLDALPEACLIFEDSKIGFEAVHSFGATLFPITSV